MTQPASPPPAQPPASDGPNARPRDAPIGQTNDGLPDDSTRPVEITPEEEAAIAREILKP